MLKFFPKNDRGDDDDDDDDDDCWHCIWLKYVVVLWLHVHKLSMLITELRCICILD